MYSARALSLSAVY